MLAPYALLNPARLTTQFPELLTDDDADFLVSVASELIRKELGGRSLGFAIVSPSRPLKISGTGTLELHLPRWPIRSVEELRIDGQLVTDWEFVEEELLEQQTLYRDAGWPIVAKATGRLVRDPDPSLVERNITVAYTAGYILPQWDGIPDDANNPAGAATDLPYRFQQACLWAVQDWIERPTSGLMGERTPGGWSQQWQMSEPKVLSARAVGLLTTDGGFWF